MLLDRRTPVLFFFFRHSQLLRKCVCEEGCLSVPLTSERILHKLFICFRIRDSVRSGQKLLREIFGLMKDFYWSSGGSGSIEYHHCCSVRINQREGKAASKPAFAYVVLDGGCISSASQRLFNSFHKNSVLPSLLSSWGDFKKILIFILLDTEFCSVL